MEKLKIKTKFTTSNGYQWKEKDSTAICSYHTAHTIKNRSWKWWKFWTERFISIPAGWRVEFGISGNLELPIKPTWANKENE